MRPSALWPTLAEGALIHACVMLVRIYAQRTEGLEREKSKMWEDAQKLQGVIKARDEEIVELKKRIDVLQKQLQEAQDRLAAGSDGHADLLKQIQVRKSLVVPYRSVFSAGGSSLHCHCPESSHASAPCHSLAVLLCLLLCPFSWLLLAAEARE